MENKDKENQECQRYKVYQSYQEYKLGLSCAKLRIVELKMKLQYTHQQFHPMVNSLKDEAK